MKLQLVHTRRDMPPLWDGRAVEWSTWNSEVGSWAFHASIDDRACHECGVLDEHAYSSGLLTPEPGATFMVPRDRRARSRRESEVPAWPVYSLFAVRCTGCGHTQVHDEDTGETWVLDESDYTDAGSWPEPEGVLF